METIKSARSSSIGGPKKIKIVGSLFLPEVRTIVNIVEQAGLEHSVEASFDIFDVKG